MAAAFALVFAAITPAMAQSSDARLVGIWRGNVGVDQLEMTFGADGTVKMAYQGNALTGSYKADFGQTPGVLTLHSPNNDVELKSLAEFIDDNHLRMSEPAAELPASMGAGSPVIFERAPSTP